MRWMGATTKGCTSSMPMDTPNSPTRIDCSGTRKAGSIRRPRIARGSATARSGIESSDPDQPRTAEVMRMPARFLFVDDHHLSEIHGLTRTMHPLDKHPANPVLRPD